MVIQTVVGKCEGRRLLGRAGQKWEDNIKRNLQEVGKGAWTVFRQGQVVSFCEHGSGIVGSIKIEEFIHQPHFSRTLLHGVG
jgi:hypothetical protein